MPIHPRIQKPFKAVSAVTNWSKPFSDLIQNWRKFRQMEVSFIFSYCRSRQPEGKPTPPLTEAPLLPTHSPREGAGPNVGRWITIKAIDGKRPTWKARKPDIPMYSNTCCLAYCATSHGQHDVSHKSNVSLFGLKD